MKNKNLAQVWKFKKWLLT